VIEKRSIALETTADPSITGYAIRFDSLSLDLGGFRERIAPGAFTRSLADTGNDVLAYWNHNPDMPLGRRSAGTLSLSEDQTGVRVEIKPDDTTHGTDAWKSVRSGTVKGMSFGFRTVKDNWARVSGEWIRTLLDADLVEVSPTPAPAYPATTATAS
jgi:HK97 family phage prohead protease